MGTKITLPFFILFITTIGIAQTRKQIQGKIVVSNASASNVLVLNLNTEQEVKSDRNGNFVILVQLDDVLLFSSENLNFFRKIIGETEFQLEKLEVEMTSKAFILEEVEIVDNKSYNAVDLGILQRPAKSYTPMERRLKTAGDFKPIHLLGLLGGSVQLDPIFNAINGKTKRLKKEILLERNIRKLENFRAFFPEKELVEDLKMNSDEVSEFTYSILDEKEFETLLENRDKSKMQFYLIEKYSQFKNKKKFNESH